MAFIASNEVWLMNIDGSELRALTSDKTPKTNLQWIPGTDRLVFISGTTVKSLDTASGQSNTLMSFRFAQYLDEFRLSPDGKQAIRLSAVDEEPRELGERLARFVLERGAAAPSRKPMSIRKG